MASSIIHSSRLSCNNWISTKNPPPNFISLNNNNLSIINCTRTQLCSSVRMAVNNNNSSSSITSGKQSPSVDRWIHEGLITESLPNGMFRVRLDNQDLILGYISGKIRTKFIRIVIGDKVKIEVNRYDSTKGRITFRLGDKDSKDKEKKMSKSK